MTGAAESSRTGKVLALSFGHALNTLITLASGMILARVLSQTDLATYRQTLLAYDVASPVLMLGLGSGIYYFLPTEKTRARGVVVDGIVLTLAMGLVYAAFIALGGNHLLASRFSNPAIVNTLVYFVPLPLFLLPAKLLPPVMVVQGQVQDLTIYNVTTHLVLGLTVVAACLVWQTPEEMIIVRVVVSVGIGATGVWLMLRALPKDSWRPRWRTMKAMIQYSTPMVGATAMGTLSLQLDKLIVSSLCPPEEFAVYVNGAIEIPLVAILTGSITAVIQPELRRMVVAEDFEGAVGLFRTAATKSAVVLMPVMVFMFLSAEPFILTLFSSKYAGSVLPFQMYLLLLPARIVNYGAFMMALGLSKLIMYRAAVGLAANALLGVVLVHWLGYIGAIVSSVVCLYFINIALNLAAISRATKCPWWRVLPFGNVGQLLGAALLAGVPVVALGVLPVALPPVVALAINAAVYAGALAAVAWLLPIEPLRAEIRAARGRLGSLTDRFRKVRGR